MALLTPNQLYLGLQVYVLFARVFVDIGAFIKLSNAYLIHWHYEPIFIILTQ
jgi:hypothetical protein